MDDHINDLIIWFKMNCKIVSWQTFQWKMKNKKEIKTKNSGEGAFHFDRYCHDFLVNSDFFSIWKEAYDWS